MANLIVGHTTEKAARLWVRGDRRDRTCTLDVQTSDGQRQAVSRIEVTPERDYTGIADIDDLAADTDYRVIATFESGAVVHGRFRTAPRRDQAAPFSFVLSSCNLSVVSLNNLLAFLVAMAGAYAARESLKLPHDRWKLARFTWLFGPAAWLARLCINLGGLVVKIGTGAKQPGPPMMRSPFLKLSAVFEPWIVEVAAAERPALGVGDRVTAGGATCVVACSPVALSSGAPVESTRASRETPATAATPATWYLVVAAVEGTLRKNTDLETAAGSRIGIIQDVASARPWYTPPSFFIHAGDQIYYDFPWDDREPARRDYRLAYREAWFQDEALQYLLAHWANFMTLDDHEIADQFARDFVPPVDGRLPLTYLRESAVAYEDYAQALNPPETRAAVGSDGGPGPYWYHFDRGSARFFVLDTRTRREASEGCIIDDVQMQALLDWMSCYEADLKFVVTSVPFVAELNDAESSRADRWTGSSAGAGRNPENDKWCAAPFRAQRTRIIDHVFRNRIQNLVFLTGDVHCCYHATMSIGDGSPYDAVTVHELAGGPANQLQLADVKEFHVFHTGVAGDRVPYTVRLDRFHTQVSAVMHLSVDYVDRGHIGGAAGRGAPEVTWNVIRTLTDVSASAWKKADAEPYALSGEPTMTGRIRFVGPRGVEQLREWSGEPAGAAPA